MRRVGAPRRHYRRTDSTNDRARGLAAAGAPSGTVVTADEQTAGRGRAGRRWSAPAGGALLYSMVVRPLVDAGPLLPLAVPVAVCEAAEALAPVRCEIKWPNDVWLERRKLAGVLIEARSGSKGSWAVIGVGLNVAIDRDDFPSDLRWPATSLGHGATVSAALDALNERLGRWIGAAPEAVLGAYRQRDALRGERIGWEWTGGEGAPGTGIAEGVDENGNLLVSTERGKHVALGAGEVRLRLD